MLFFYNKYRPSQFELTHMHRNILTNQFSSLMVNSSFRTGEHRSEHMTKIGVQKPVFNLHEGTDLSEVENPHCSGT